MRCLAKTAQESRRSFKIVPVLYKPGLRAAFARRSAVEFASPRDAIAARDRRRPTGAQSDPAILRSARTSCSSTCPPDEAWSTTPGAPQARRGLELLDRDHRYAGRSGGPSRSRKCRSSKSPRRSRSRPKVLLLDEPTASITEREAAALFAILRRLAAGRRHRLRQSQARRGALRSLTASPFCVTVGMPQPESR